MAAVATGGIGLVTALVFLRFCGDVSLPAKPPPPRFDKTAGEVVDNIKASTEGYRQTIERDAARARIAAPSAAELGRKLDFRRDDSRRVLIPGAAPVDVLGIRISAVAHRIDRAEHVLALVIENPGPRPVAYLVDTEVSSGKGSCQGRTLIPYNGMVVAPGAREVRSECAYKRGVELYVGRVETVEVTPLAAYYLGLVPPQAVGVPDRVGRGHRTALPAGVGACAISMAQGVRSAMEDGEIGWRDLVDFYARHPCSEYQFPDGYKAFGADGERELPAVGD